MKDVWVHSNADRVELFLNGASLGAKDMPRYGHLQWRCRICPRQTGSQRLRQKRQSDRLRRGGDDGRGHADTAHAQQQDGQGDGEEVVMVEAALLDAQGRVVPYADNQVTFTTTGSGQVAGVGNGDASSHEPDRATSAPRVSRPVPCRRAGRRPARTHRTDRQRARPRFGAHTTRRGHQA